MKRKKYKKPVCISSDGKEAIIPALAVGAALAGGYVVGRVVKQIEFYPNMPNHTSLAKVY